MFSIVHLVKLCECPPTPVCTSTCIYTTRSHMLIHTHAQNQLSPMMFASCVQSKHHFTIYVLYSISCHQYVRVFAPYHRPSHAHDCCTTECSARADGAIDCRYILSSGVLRFFQLGSYCLVLCIRHHGSDVYLGIPQLKMAAPM